MGAGIGARDVAGDLRGVVFPLAQEREHRGGRVAGLLLEHAEIDGAAVDARRRAGLQPADRERQLAQAPREGVAGLVARTTAFVVGEADVDPASEEGADREHHRAGAKAQAHRGDDAGDAAALEDQVVGRLLEKIEVRLALQHRPHRGLVEHAVGLGARGAHRGSLAGIEDAELDPRPVGGPRHQAAERVDLLDQVPLADAADGGVAAHLAQRLDVVGQQQRARADARGGERGLGSGVPATDHDDVVALGVVHHGLRAILGPRIVDRRRDRGDGADRGDWRRGILCRQQGTASETGFASDTP